MRPPFFLPLSFHLLTPRALATLTAAAVVAGCVSLKGPEALNRADELTVEGRYDDAIAAYQEHIQDRLGDGNRPEWENPYFYLLNIGDIELKRDNPEKALARYEEAEQRGVALSLVADRYRAVATWHEERHELQKALEVLNTYRLKDPLIFDSMLDRIARELTQSEIPEK